MNESLAELADKLYTLASSELFLYKGMLSVTRLIAINLKNGGENISDALYEKQKSYMDEIDAVHSGYISALKGVENNALKAVLFLNAPIPSGSFPEFSQLFPVLSELRTTIDKIIERNNYAREQSAKLSLECMDKIRELKKDKAYSAVFDVKQSISAGQLFNYSEK